MPTKFDDYISEVEERAKDWRSGGDRALGGVQDHYDVRAVCERAGAPLAQKQLADASRELVKREQRGSAPDRP